MDKVLNPAIILTHNQAISLNPLSQTVETNNDETFNRQEQIQKKI